MSKTRLADRIAPCPAYAMLKGTGGPAGMVLQPPLTGVRCTTCERPLGMEYRAPDGKPKCALCIRREEATP